MVPCTHHSVFAEEITYYQAIKEWNNLFLGRFGKGRAGNIGGGTQAGLGDWDVSLDFQVSDLDDEISDSDGDSRYFELDFSKPLGDGVWGWGVGYNHLEFDGAADFESRAWGLHLHASTPVTDYLDIGYIGLAQDIDSDGNNNGYAITNSVLASYHGDFGGDIEFGITPAVVVTNADDGEETTFVCLVDVYWPVSDATGVWIYGVYQDGMSGGNPIDDSNWNVGIELGWELNDTTQLTIGYETSMDISDFESDSYRASLVFRF
jgi:hypothetical protein